MNRFIYLLLLIGLHSHAAFAQLTLESCQQKARDNYPQLRQYGLLEKSEAFSLSNTGKGYLPQVSVTAQASYQSDITSLPQGLGQALSQVIGQPIDFQSINKDQYKVVAEVNQLLWDGGSIRTLKETIKATTEVEKQKLEVELYNLKERINQLFFGTLALNEQLIQVELLQRELQSNFERVKVYQTNGMANQSDADMIRVEQLKAVQKSAELMAVRQSYLAMLSAMTGDASVTTSTLQKPEYQMTEYGEATINRPELQFLQAQTNTIAHQENHLKATNLPKMGLFAQGGYGNPGLNMLEPGFTPWYIVGARLSWNFSGLYTQKNKLNKLVIDRQNIELQKETFLFNTRLQVTRANHEIARIREQLKSDDEIIALRNSIKKAAEAKVENGTLTVTDLLREITAENTAIQDKSLREIQLLMAIHHYNTLINHSPL